jgi:two-component sensor histidine kinase
LQKQTLDLIDFGRHLALNQDLAGLLQASTQPACKLAGADTCILWSIASTPISFTPKAWHPRRNKSALPPLTNKGWRDKLFRLSAPLFLSSAQVKRGSLGKTFGVTRLAFLPLKIDEKLWGMLSFAGGKSDLFSEEEQLRLQLISERIESAIRLRLLSEQKAHLQKQILLLQADQKTQAQPTELDRAGRPLTAPSENDRLIKTTLSAIARTLHCPIVGVALLSADGILQLDKSKIIGAQVGAAGEIDLKATPGSLLGQALRRQGPTPVSDALDDPLGKLLRAKSLVGLPLSGPAGGLGALFVAHRKAYSFSDGELTLLSVYASKIALLLLNAELVQGQTRNLDQLATLSEISRGFAVLGEMPTMLRSALSSIGRLLAMKSGLLLLRETETGKLASSAAWGFEKSISLRKALEQLETTGNLAELAQQQQKVQVSSDLSRDGRFDYRKLARNGGPHAAIVAPLRSGGKTLGAICLYTGESRKFPEQDKRILAIMADTLGLAIDNSFHQREEKRRNAAYSELFREVNRQVRGNLQTIVALLEMSSAYPGVSTAEALRRTLQRIQCIHLIHSLFSSPTLKAMEVRQSTRQIAEMAQLSCGKSREEIAVRISGTRVLLSPQKATAFSLAINELINNALAHGFKETLLGQIQIDFSQSGGNFLIEVSDNGCGLPGTFDLERDSRIGLKIVSTFVQQRLGGDFRLFRRSGSTVAQLRFPC